MDLKGEYTFDGPREEVWKLLQDPEVLANALPGAKELNQISDDEYEGTLNVKVGPVNGVFTSKVTLKDKVAPESYTMVVDSKGAPGFAKGTAYVTLTALEGGQTKMQYEAKLQVGGRIASVGQRMLDTVSKSLTRQGLEAMNLALQARLDAAEGEEATFTPPSQADVAREVAKDVIADSRSWLWIVIALLIVVAIIAYFFFV